MREKDRTIDALRGLAVVLMVACHVIGDTTQHGLRAADGSFLRMLYAASEPVRMPLFTVISGFLFAGKALPEGSFPSFLRGKAERLLVPFFTVGTLQLGLRMVVPDTNAPAQPGDLWKFYVYAGDQFWFLQAAFLVMMTMFAVERAGLMRTFPRWAATFAVAVLLNLFFPRFTRVFSLPAAFYLLPYFTLGIGLARYGEMLLSRGVALAAGVGVVLGYAVHAMHMSDVGVVHRSGVVPLVIGVTACTLLFRFRRFNALLAAIGPMSLTIFLFHVLPTAGSRIVLARLGIHAHAIVFPLALAAGIAFPMLVHRVLSQSPLAARLFLGEPPKRAKRDSGSELAVPVLVASK
jgi:fucose 4-O-acetylase-like acetyltransferase